jgi:hypothetical protein
MHGFIKVEIALQSEEILPRKKGKEERAKKKKQTAFYMLDMPKNLR